MLHHEKALPVNVVTAVGLGLAAIAFVLAVYGSLVAPGHLRASLLSISPDMIRAVGYTAPLALGLVAVVLGLVGLHRIEARGGRLGGDMQGVFAVMIGGLAAVVGGVQVFADTIWPLVWVG